MIGLTYLRYELLRTFRNRRFFIFSLIFPLVLYYAIAAPNRGLDDFGGTGLSAPLYYMIGLTAFGSMMAMLSSGARIAGERQVGWNRQLRISPLTPGSYLRAKVITGYLTAIVSIVVLYVAGVTLGVSLPAGRWLAMTGLILIGLVPFSALGIMVGHAVTVDSIGPVMGGVVSLLALLGGTWFPLGDSGLMHDIGVALPSYWLVQASHIALGGGGWSLGGWLVMAGWTVVLSALAARAYWRDTRRV